MKKLWWIAPICLWLTGCANRPTVDPALLVLDKAALAKFGQALEDGDYGQIHSLLIWHHDELVWEQYFQGYSRETRSQVYSVTKSVTSAAVGLALAQGHLASINEPVRHFFPQQYENVAPNSAWKQSLTVAHLLTMTAGLQWDELSADFYDARNDARRLAVSDDWLQHVLDQPMVAAPGTSFTYNSGATMLLSGILQASTGQSVADFTADQLWQPLGIEDWQWETGKPDITNTGWGLFLRPFDMLTFGRLYLQNGRWQGQQIIPEEWIAQSTQSQIEVDKELDFGYHWWRLADSNRIVQSLSRNDLYFATGYGGQFIIIIPHLEMVIVTTAANYTNSNRFLQALPKHIFPALTPPPATATP